MVTAAVFKNCMIYIGLNAGLCSLLEDPLHRAGDHVPN